MSSRTRQAACRVLLAGLAAGFVGGTGAASRAGAGAKPLIGVKIYDPVPDAEALFRQWKRLGIDAAFVSTAIAESETFIPAARRAGIRTFVITPVFFNPDYLAAHPDAWAITGRGERAKDDWVEFVCPSLEGYREERKRYALSLLERRRPDGLSLDFIRHFVFWEQVRPDGRVDALDTTCFCPRCLARFERDEGLAMPAVAKASPRAAAGWLLANHADRWVRWRAGLVTSWVEGVVREARRVAPGVKINLHLVPWGESEYQDGPIRVAGQDVRALGPLADFVSPMCYAHMLHRDPAWVGRVVRDLDARVAVPVLPSIEVEESYRQEPLTREFFAAALDAALAPPSGGVVFWSWAPLSKDEARQEIVVRRAGAGPADGRR
jgi:ribosomal protein S27AE